MDLMRRVREGAVEAFRGQPRVPLICGGALLVAGAILVGVSSGKGSRKVESGLVAVDEVIAQAAPVRVVTPIGSVSQPADKNAIRQPLTSVSVVSPDVQSGPDVRSPPATWGVMTWGVMLSAAALAPAGKSVRAVARSPVPVASPPRAEPPVQFPGSISAPVSGPLVGPPSVAAQGEDARASKRARRKQIIRYVYVAPRRNSARYRSSALIPRAVARNLRSITRALTSIAN